MKRISIIKIDGSRSFLIEDIKQLSLLDVMRNCSEVLILDEVTNTKIARVEKDKLDRLYLYFY